MKTAAQHEGAGGAVRRRRRPNRAEPYSLTCIGTVSKPPPSLVGLKTFFVGGPETEHPVHGELFSHRTAFFVWQKKTNRIHNRTNNISQNKTKKNPRWGKFAVLGCRSIKNHPNLPAQGVAKKAVVSCLFLLVSVGFACPCPTTTPTTKKRSS